VTRPRHARRPAVPGSGRSLARSRRDILPGGVRHRLEDERGNALVEFVVLSAALLIPTLYLVLTLGSVQAAAFAADTIARDAARIHATESDPERAAARASRHMEMVLEDHGLPVTDVVELSCSEDPCATPGGIVTARVRIPVPVPGLGPILGERGPVAVGASHSVPVDQYRADL
jgi:hypothetical protein